MSQPARKSAGGRPPKFDEPSRPITLTLPDSVLEDLLRVDADRSQAIVKLAREALRKDGPEAPLVQLVGVGQNRGVIMVRQSKALQRIPFVKLVEVGPGRCILALDSGNDFRTLEIGVLDVLETIPPEEKRDIQLMSELLVEIRKLRKSARLSMAEILLISMEEK